MVGWGGGGGGQMCNDSSMKLYATSADSYCCSTALRVRSYVEAMCPEDEKPCAEIQIDYKHARILHTIIGLRDVNAHRLRTLMEVVK